MSSMDTIIIFQKPELYFFPHYQDIVFAPFSMREKSLRYYLYRLLHLLHLPGYSLFWGAWKERVRSAGRVVIFDYGYQRGMERYIRRVNPGCRVIIFYWNRVGKYNALPLRTVDHESIYSTDPEDCRLYHLKYNHIFYPKDRHTPPLPSAEGKLFFIGADKGRAPYLLGLKKVLEEAGLACDIRVLPRKASLFRSKDTKAYREQFAEILTDTPLSYEEYISLLSRCNVLLDVNQKGQTSLTMRVLESVFLSKKLITGNQNIINYDFYNADNIFVLPEDGSLPAPSAIHAFLQRPYVPYPEEILDAYSFEHWKANFR